MGKHIMEYAINQFDARCVFLLAGYVYNNWLMMKIYIISMLDCFQKSTFFLTKKTIGEQRAIP